MVALNSEVPLLVLVHGPPASGKSSLASRLATATGMQLVSRDAYKEALLDDVWRIGDERLRRAAGHRAYELFYSRIVELVTAGLSVVAETAMHAGISENQLAPVLCHADPIILYCDAPVEVLRQRYLHRVGASEAHPCHLDPDDVESVRSGTFDWGLYRQLDLDVPCLTVDTTRPIDLVALLNDVESALSRAVLARGSMADDLLRWRL